MSTESKIFHVAGDQEGHPNIVITPKKMMAWTELLHAVQTLGRTDRAHHVRMRILKSHMEWLCCGVQHPNQCITYIREIWAAWE